MPQWHMDGGQFGKYNNRNTYSLHLDISLYSQNCILLNFWPCSAPVCFLPLLIMHWPLRPVIYLIIYLFKRVPSVAFLWEGSVNDILIQCPSVLRQFYECVRAIIGGCHTTRCSPVGTGYMRNMGYLLTTWQCMSIGGNTARLLLQPRQWETLLDSIKVEL